MEGREVLFWLTLVTAVAIAIPIGSQQVIADDCGCSEYDWECLQNCAPSAYCGDGWCDSGESCTSCPSDCQQCRAGDYCSISSQCSPGLCCINGACASRLCDPSSTTQVSCGNGQQKTVTCSADGCSKTEGTCQYIEALCRQPTACETRTFSSTTGCTYTPIAPLCDDPATVACGTALTTKNGCGTCTGKGTKCDTGYKCTSTGCVPDCTPACPDPTTVTCGAQITPTNNCGQCTGTGTKCQANYVCTSGQCTCTPTTWTGDTSNTCPSTTVTQTSNCGTTRQVAGTKQTVWSAFSDCSCTPTCGGPCTGTKTKTDLNGCAAPETVTCTVAATTCTDTQVCHNNACITQTFSIADVPSTITVSPSSPQTLTPRLVPSAGNNPTFTWSTTGYANQQFTSVLSITGQAAKIGQTTPITITATSGSRTLATTTTNVKVICSSASECTGTECSPASCTSGVCSQVPKTGGTCSGGGTCSAGICSTKCQDIIRENPTFCSSKNTRTAAGSANIDNGCTITLRTHNILQEYTCATTGDCTPATKDEYVTTGTQNKADGTTCTIDNKPGACINGACVPHQCVTAADCPSSPCHTTSCVSNKCVNTPKSREVACADVSAGGAINWERNLSMCINEVNMCGYECTRTGLLGHSCDEATDGICTGVKTCKTACPSGLYPGCIPSSEGTAEMEATANGCKQEGYLCFKCRAGYVYDTTAGECITSEYSLKAEPQKSRAGTITRINPTLYGSGDQALGNANHNVQYDLALTDLHLTSFDAFEFTLEEPGMYTAVLTATQSRTGKVLATTSTQVTVTCPANDPCCTDGATSYKAEGSACEIDHIIGTCQNNKCITACTPSSYIEQGSLCNNGVDDDCNGQQDCADTNCATFCPANIRCDPGQVICSSACTDVSKSNKHCGACNTACGLDEQCIRSVCTKVENCQIVCNADRDCRKGEVCINAGDCKKSYCAPANSLQPTTESVDRITNAISTTKTYKITKELRASRIRITISNLAPVALRNFTLNVNINFPKQVVSSAGELTADYPFTIIQDDPVIEFTFPEIKSEQVVLIDLPKQADPALIESVYVDATHNEINEQPAVLGAEDATITTNYVKEGGKSKLVIGLDPHAKLQGVRIPIEIPKCMLESAANATVAGSGTYEIIKDDPLVVWKLDAVSDKQTLEIEIGNADTDCRDQLTAFAVADGVQRRANPWLPLLIIPIIGIIIIFFQRFHPSGDAQERLSRKEFEQLAREQGTPPEELEQAWKDYQNKW